MAKQGSQSRPALDLASIDVPSRPSLRCFSAGRAGMTERSAVWATLATLLTVVPGCTAFPDAQATRGLGEKMVADAYPGMPEALAQRAVFLAPFDLAVDDTPALPAIDEPRTGPPVADELARSRIFHRFPG